MGLESATFIHQLNPAWPIGASDPVGQGDDQIRLLKTTIQATFPGIAGAVTATHTQINSVVGSGITGFAAPSVDVDLAAPTAGAATTGVRSDAKLRLSVAIVPTWTGLHTFSAAGGFDTEVVRFKSNAPMQYWEEADAAANTKIWIDKIDGGIKRLAVSSDAGAYQDYFRVVRAGASVSQLDFGNATSNPAYNFLGTGTVTVNGTVVSAGVVTSNGVAAGAVGSFNASSATPGAFFNETDQAAGAKLWRDFINGGVRNFEITDDAGGTARTWLSITRTGAAVTSENFGNATDNPAYNFLGTGAVGVGGAINATGAINSTSDVRVNGNSVLSVPRSTTITTLAIGDRGKCVAVSAAINIPASVFAAGDCVSIYNDSAASINITTSAGTLRLAGTTSTGTRALAPRGMATLWFNVGGATPETICSGPGVS